MRHRLVVLAAVLAIAGLAACSRDKNDRPTPQAQPPVPSVSTHPGMAFTALPSASASAGPSAGAGPTSATGPGNPTDPAGAGIGRPQTLPTGTVISATGIGPYTIGQEQASLTAAKLVGSVKNGSTGCDTGAGQAKWGSPTLIFTKGKLQHLKIADGAVKTTSGIKVGSTEASVRSAYGKGSALSAGGKTAWYAPTGDFALLFRIAGGKVSTIESGPASTLSITFTDNQGC
jgi:hypothetical protein